MPPHACLLRSLGRHALRVAPAPPVDHAHRPLHCKVSITRHVSFLWSGRVHGPHPFIIAERPSQLKPNAAMFHDASRECPPRDPPTWSRAVTGVGGVSDATENICTSGVRCLPSEGSHLHQSGSSSHPKRSRQNEPHAFRGGRRGAMARAETRASDLRAAPAAARTCCSPKTSCPDRCAGSSDGPALKMRANRRSARPCDVIRFE